jgi:MoxR-like ATPase
VDHLPEVLKIIEGAVKSNATQVSSYAELLAAKLEKEGNSRAAKSVRRKLSSAASGSFALANGLQVSMPVDKDSRLSLADETNPLPELNKIVLSNLVSASVEEFIGFVQQADVLENAGVGVSPSMLIYGPPGCGKTLLANYIAAKLALPLLTARCDTLVSSYLGSTAKNIRRLFEHSSSRPCVLFLDEFDALAKARDDRHEVGELKRVVVSLLQNIDSLPSETVIIAATNHHSLLDSAVWRRFAYRLQLDLPGEECRARLFKEFLNGYMTQKNLNPLVSASDGMSGALIRQACESSIRATLIDGKQKVEPNEVLARLAYLQHHDLIDSGNSTEEKIVQLKEKNPKAFTTRVLSQVFGVSIGKVSQVLNA